MCNKTLFLKCIYSDPYIRVNNTKTNAANDHAANSVSVNSDMPILNARNKGKTIWVIGGNISVGLVAAIYINILTLPLGNNLQRPPPLEYIYNTE